MRLRITIFIFSIILSNCITEKICSDKDRGCGTHALILSLFSAPPGVYLYATVGSYQGNLAAFGSTFDSSLANICAGQRVFAQIPDLSCSRTLPFVSTSTTAMSAYTSAPYFVPSTLVPVRGGPRGVTIAFDWSTSISGAIDRTMSEAGVTSGEFWTFATSGGAYNGADNCSNGTSLGTVGMVGDPNDTAASWFGSTITANCSEFKKVLCICY